MKRRSWPIFFGRGRLLRTMLGIGTVTKGNISSFVGALALTDQRVLGTLSSGPKNAGRSVDHQWNAPAGSMVQARLDQTAKAP